ncbi:rho-guanine nucleotide exchange factor-like isoform 1 [Camelus ferus]|nr:rho-guanine nucleotide exchange factor-like isoform 1 [Camelus ferus]
MCSPFLSLLLVRGGACLQTKGGNGGSLTLLASESLRCGGSSISLQDTLETGDVCVQRMVCSYLLFSLDEPSELEWKALALPNEEGATPLDLALHGGHSQLVEDITNFQGRRSPGFSRVQLSEDASLQYIHSSETLTLTLNHTAEHLLEADINLFRKYFWDRAFLIKALEEQEARSEEKPDMPSSAAETAEEIKNLVFSRSSPGKQDGKCVRGLETRPDACEDPDSLDAELPSCCGEVWAEKPFPGLRSENLAPKEAKPDCSCDVLRRSRHPPVFLAAGRLSDMLNGGDEVYANCMVIDQVGDLDINYINIEGVTTDACPESMGSTRGPQSSKLIPPTQTSPGVSPPKENKGVTSYTEAQPSFISSSSSYASNLNLSFGLHGFEKEQSHLKKRSSSLDALDADSEGEGQSEQPHRCFTPVSQSSSRTGLPSGDELDSFETNPEADFNISRTESLSLSSNPQLKVKRELVSHTSVSESGLTGHVQRAAFPAVFGFRRSGMSLESESDGSTWRSRSHSDELFQPMGSSPSTDSFLMEVDVVDSSVWRDLSGDAQEFEAESWSLVVDPSFCSRQEKDVIKRQDVIFELMQTEMHHIQTLLIMSEVFRKGMKEELQLDHSTVDKIFPCLDELLEIHRHFFYSMKERRQESGAGSDRNFIINRIGDILVQQRITKYPVLVERILQYSKESTEEHKDLCKALGLIKDMIAAVDLKVSEYEKKQKWLEILSKIENKTYTKLKNGHVFRKQTLMSKERTLLYDGLVYWKTATGRFKEVVNSSTCWDWAGNDQKPSVISLQKLIAREVANEERGMFLISASSAGPEMYEIHTNSKEERNTWMRRIQQAVESGEPAGGSEGLADERCEPVIGARLRRACFAGCAQPSGCVRIASCLVLIGPGSNEERKVFGKSCFNPCTAALTIQDSHIEIHRLVLQQQESLSPGPFFRGSPFQDQERYRNLEKRREELANIHKLQHQFQQDQQRWHRRCDQQQREQAAKASWLQERERECQSQEELLLRSRGELDQQLQEYQQNLERLREGQRLVERERERMRAQQSLLCGWKHSRQSSLPSAFSPGSMEVRVFRAYESRVTNENQVDLKMDLSQPLDVSHELWIAAGSCHQIPPLHQSSEDPCKNDLDISQTEYPPLSDSNPHGPQLQTFIAEAKLSLQRVTSPDGESGDGAEENIVYL